MTHLKSAIELRLRPSAHILMLKRPASDWSVWDHKFALAFSRLNAEMCDKCGNPIWVCRNPDKRIRFEVDTYTCYADKELSKRRKDREKKKKDLKDGEYEYVRAVPDFGVESLPTRDDYYEYLAKESAPVL
jgi:hypothetical protein